MRGINVIRKVNGGVSSARNVALDAARGEYLLFLDADDYLESNALSVMIAAIETEGAALVGGGWKAVDEDGQILHSFSPGTSAEDGYVTVAKSGLAVGGVLIKRRTDIRFNETTSSEAWEADEYFLDYLSLGERAIFVNDIVVNRRQSNRPQRLTNKLNHFEPMRTGTFFAGCKERLSALGVANAERFAALDKRIVNSIHCLLRAKRYRDAKTLAERVSRNLPPQYARYRVGSFAWFFKWGGIRAGILFVKINRVIGRG
jgi:glycosyltransferase involved in cell wall biosynthesis